MQVIDELILEQSKTFAKKFEDLVITSLNEAGYNTLDRRAIAERCESFVKEDTKVRELWIDHGKASARLIARFTDPVSVFEEAGGVYTGKIEFSFAPVHIQEGVV